MSQIHSTWLMPCADDAQLFSQIVESLSQTFDTPRFEPHLTLLQDRSVAADRLAQFWHGIEAGAPITTHIADVGSGTAYFRSLYARIADDGRLAMLHGLAVTAFGPEQETFMPHVSLAYGVPESGMKQETRSRLAADLRGRQVRFDCICVVSSGKDVPIADWTVRHRILLG